MKYILRSCLLIVLLCWIKNNTSAQDTSIISTSSPKTPKNKIIKYGIASYYAKKFEGRKTYTDVTYNAALLTAACNVLPMGTWVKVTNLKNNRSVVVEINDKLAAWNKRLIDLTYRAAKKLGYVGSGITRVKVEVLVDLKKTPKNVFIHKHKRLPSRSKNRVIKHNRDNMAFIRRNVSN